MEDALGGIFNSLLEENFSSEKLMLMLVKKKLKEYDIKLTAQQEKHVGLQLQKNGLEGFSFQPNRSWPENKSCCMRNSSFLTERFITGGTMAQVWVPSRIAPMTSYGWISSR